MLKKFFYYAIIVDLVFLVFGYGREFSFRGPIVEVFFSLLILVVVLALPSIPLAAILIIAELLGVFAAGRLRQAYLKIPSRVKTKNILRRVLSLILTEEEQESISGDLREECLHFESKTEGRIWLCRQIIKSIPPLAYKNLKSRLASYLEERIR